MSAQVAGRLPRLSRHYHWYVLSLLWVVALLRFVDLQILAVLLEPIKAEFKLTDTQLSLLGGLAFALFYGTLGIPIAWLAERYSRRTIIACAVALWSLMTALCGQATGFASLFFARMGVGIGEAGAYPPSTSLLAACTFTLGATGSGIWLPSYFIRHHGISGAEIGLWMAGLYGGGGLLGSLLGGWLAARLDKDGSGAGYARISQWSLLGTLPLLPLVLLSPSAHFALCCHLGVTILMHMNVGPVLTLIQQLGGAQRRALAQAFSVLVSNLIALPLGPLLVGLFSDHFTVVLGTRTLGVAILLLLVGSWSLSAWLFGETAERLSARTAAPSSPAWQQEYNGA